ncbi:MAG: toll/interleukin-1 receptor domain-containing protein [Bacteroidota bacterium]
MDTTEEERRGLEAALNLKIELKNKLLVSRVIEYNAAVQFQLDHQIAAIEKEIAELKEKLNRVQQPAAGHAVFISYNHGDSDVMLRVKDYLEKEQLKVIADVQNMQAAEDIQSFINQSMQDARFILTLVSEKSLRSGWVGRELAAASLLAQTGKIWLPARLDDAVFKDEFYSETLEYLDAELRKLDEKMMTAIRLRHDTRPYESARARLLDLKNNLGPSVANLREKLLVNIAENQFGQGMHTILSTIRYHR